MGLLQLPKIYDPDFATPSEKSIEQFLEVDRTNPITEGMKSFFLLNQQAGSRVFDIVNQKWVDIQGLASNYNFVHDGWEQTSTSVTGAFFKLTDAREEGSIIVRYRPSSLYDFNSIFDNSAAGNDLEGWVYGDGRVAGRYDGSIAIFTSVVAGQLFDYGFSWKRNEASTGHKLYVDGVLRASTTAGNSTISGDTNLNAGNTANDHGAGIFFHAIAFDRRLSEAEFRSISLDPYQLIRPKTTPDYFTSDAAAPANLTANQTEAGDTQSATLQVVTSITADQAEDGDSQAASIQTVASISANQTEAGDTQSAAISSAASITANQAEAGDTQSANIDNVVSITANQAEAGDTQAASIVGVLTSSITANQTEAGDTQSATLSNVVSITANQLEAGDAQAAVILTQEVTRNVALTLRSPINDTITLKSPINDIITIKSKLA